jgi:hypothetical protein
MATKTIYVPDEDLQVFDKAKDLAGDSLSAVVIQALKDFILKKELEEKAMQAIKLWKGSEDLNSSSIDGQYIKFYGKPLSEASFEIDKYHFIHYELYLTKKRQYLLYSVDENLKEGIVVSDYSPPFSDLKEIMKRVPAKLIIDAEKQMPGVLCEELDV